MARQRRAIKFDREALAPPPLGLKGAPSEGRRGRVREPSRAYKAYSPHMHIPYSPYIPARMIPSNRGGGGITAPPGVHFSFSGMRWARPLRARLYRRERQPSHRAGVSAHPGDDPRARCVPRGAPVLPRRGGVAFIGACDPPPEARMLEGTPRATALSSPNDNHAPRVIRQARHPTP